MSRRNRGVKISLQELGTAFGGLRVAEFPTQSSEVDGTDREEKDWFTKQRLDTPVSENRRTHKYNEHYGSFRRNQDTVDEELNWRRNNSGFSSVSLKDGPSNSSTEDWFNRESLAPRDTLNSTITNFNAKNSSFGNRDSRFLRQTDSDVDFSTVREGPRRVPSGQNTQPLSRHSSSRPFFLSRTTENHSLVNDSLPWRNTSVKPTLDKPSTPLNTTVIHRKIDLKEKETKKQIDTSVAESKELSIADNVESPMCSETRSVENISRPLSAKEASTEKCHNKDSVSDASSLVEGAFPQNTVPKGSITASGGNTTMDTVQLKQSHVDVVSRDLEKKKVETKQSTSKETDLQSKTDTTSKGTTVGLVQTGHTVSSAKEKGPAALWRPSHVLKAEEASLSHQDKLRKGIETIVKERVAQQEKSKNTKPPVEASVAEVDRVKELYKKNMEMRKMKERQLKEEQRLQKLQAEKLQVLALERLMYGDSKKTKAIEDILEQGMIEKNPDKLFKSLRNILCDEDITSLVPSIVLVKCLIRKSLEELAPLATDLSVTDIERLQKEGDIVKIMKPSLLFLFQNSFIENHPLRFLLEIQRFVNAINFPRVSSGVSLIEAIWDGLYMQDVIEEKYFLMWYEDTEDETPGRSKVVFQMLNWFNWLKSASLNVEQDEGSESDDSLDDNLDNDDF